MSSAFDARVGFFPRKGIPQGIFGLCKITYDTRTQSPVEPEPLTPDLLDPRVPASLVPGSDSLLDKLLTDVSVHGCAFATSLVHQMEVHMTIGGFTRSLDVIGDRTVCRSGRGILFSDPKPFTRMPITWDHAYGGVDIRVPVDQPIAPGRLDHPGLYPRNPYGRGYVVEDTPITELTLPNIEDPQQRLTPETLIVDNPARWHRQPLPATFELSPPNVFPRYTFVGGTPWYPAPEDGSIAEVRRGYIRPDFQGLAAGGLHPDFWQEAAPGLARSVEPGCGIEIRGMHPTGKKLRFTVPPPPRLEVVLEGRPQCLTPMLSKLAIRPAEERFIVTWLVRTSEMHRVFLPGIQAKIPLALLVDRAVVPYQARPTVQSRPGGTHESGGLPTPPKPRRPRPG